MIRETHGVSLALGVELGALDGQGRRFAVARVHPQAALAYFAARHHEGLERARALAVHELPSTRPRSASSRTCTERSRRCRAPRSLRRETRWTRWSPWKGLRSSFRTGCLRWLVLSGWRTWLGMEAGHMPKDRDTHRKAGLAWRPRYLTRAGAQQRVASACSPTRTRARARGAQRSRHREARRGTRTTTYRPRDRTHVPDRATSC
jgi:hypothetical protein